MADKQTKQTKQTKFNFYKVLCIILMLALIIILGKLGIDKLQEYKSARAYEDMQQMVNYGSDSKSTEAPKATQVPITVDDTESSEEKTVTVEVPKKNLDWSRLQGINKDIYAWIYIPGTKVDYPVLQSTSDDSYYLNHNIDGTKGYPGCIYTEMANSKDFSDFNTVIYGHNMKNGTMFKGLHDFEKREFFEKNRYVYLYTKEKVFVYEIYITYIGDDAHILNTNDFASETGRVRYLERTANLADATGNYMPEIEVGKDSHIITLSTCTSDPTVRFLVQAVLLGSK